MSDKITALAHIHPFAPSNRLIKELPIGTTIKEFVDQFDILSGLRKIVVLNGVLIEEDRWNQVLCSAGDHIVIKAIPGGTQGIEGAGKAGGSIALLGAALMVTSFLLGPLGIAGGALIASLGFWTTFAGVSMMVGTAYYSMFMQRVNEANRVTEYLPGVSGGQNSFKPWARIPVTLGKHLITPYFASKPFTQISGSEGVDQYIYMALCVGYGPLRLSNIKLGDLLLASNSGVQRNGLITNDGVFDDVELYVYQNGTLPSDFSCSVIEDQPGNLLKYNEENWFATPARIDKLQVDITLQSGLIKYSTVDGSEEDHNVTVQARYRLQGSGTPWASCSVLGTFNLTKKLAKTIRYTAQITGLTAGSYEVGLMRTTPDDPDGFKGMSLVTWSALRSFRTTEAPIASSIRDDLVILYFKAKASASLNGILNQLNCISEAELPVYSGSGSGYLQWTNGFSRNPAVSFLAALRAVWTTRVVPNDSIDWPRIEEWFTYCNTKGWKCDAILSEDDRLKDVLNKIASTGRASLTIRDGKYSVVIDNAKTTIANQFTPRNMTKFSWNRTFKDLPDALRIGFISIDDNYSPNERVVCDDGYTDTTAVNFDTLEIWGVVDKDNVWKHGRYRIAVNRLRSIVYTFETDPEGYVCEEGDLAQIAHDAILVSQRTARIKSVTLDGSGNCVSVTIDDIVEMVSGVSYGATIRRSATGESFYNAVTFVLGESSTVSFNPIIPSTNVPAAGDILTFGEAGKVTIRVLIVGIEPGADSTFKITAVDEAPAVHVADSGTIPAFISYVSSPRALQVQNLPSIASSQSRDLSGTSAQATADVKSQTYYGTSDPPSSSLGRVGDYYVNTTNKKEWSKTGSSTWTIVNRGALYRGSGTLATMNSLTANVIEDTWLATDSSPAYTVYRYDGSAWTTSGVTSAQITGAMADFVAANGTTGNVKTVVENLAKSATFIAALGTDSLQLTSTGKIYAGVGNYGNADTPIFLGFHSGVAKFSLGAKLTYDGTTLALDGVITATSGSIGGFTIGATTITGGALVLTNTGNVAAGSSNDIARVSADDATYRLWVGHATAASAPFRVTKAGALTATSATITGTITTSSITATGGTIGGFTLAATKLSATNLVLTSGAANTANICVGTGATAGGLGSPAAGGDIAIWAGSAFADRATAAFRVTAAGALVATSATITGTVTTSNITATGGTIGGFTLAATTLSATNLVLTSGAANTANVCVGTGATAGGLGSPAASGDIAIWAGSTFANRATAAFRVTAGGALTATNATITGSITTSSLSATGGSIAAFTIAASTISATNLVLTSGAANVANVCVGTGSYAGGLGSPAASGDIALWAGSTFANRATAAFRVTAGGALTATSATITGSITSTSGSIGGFTTGSNSLSATNLVLTSGASGSANIAVGTGSYTGGLASGSAAGDILLWVGAAFADRATAAFRVSASGAITATSATISGIINSTGGAIGGWLLGTTTLQSAAAGNARIEIDSSNMRYAIIDSANTNKVVMGYLNGLQKNGATWVSTKTYAIGEYVYVGGVVYKCIAANTNQTPPNATYWSVSTDTYTSSDYGFWVAPGQTAVCDGALSIKNGDMIAYDASFKLLQNTTEILRLGADTGNIGLHLYNAGGTIRLLNSGSDQLSVVSDYGYVRIGAQNASWAHFYTDRAAYYFNVNVQPVSLTIYGTTAGFSSSGVLKVVSGGGTDSNTVYIKDGSAQLKERTIQSGVWSYNYDQSLLTTALPTFAGLTLTSGAITGDGATITANILTTGSALLVQSSSLTQGSGIEIVSTSTANNGIGSALLRATSSGANAVTSAKAYGVVITVSNTGTTNINYGVYSNVTGGTTGNFSFYGVAGKLYNAGEGEFGDRVTIQDTLAITNTSATPVNGVVSASSIATNKNAVHSIYYANSSGAQTNSNVMLCGLYADVENTGTNITNTAIYASARLGTTNYSFYGADGTLYNAGPVVFSSSLTVATNYGFTATGICKVNTGAGTDSNTVYIKDGSNQLKERTIQSGVWSYNYDQSLLTTASPTFAGLSVGSGAGADSNTVYTKDGSGKLKERTIQSGVWTYNYDQNLLTTSSPSFAGFVGSSSAATTAFSFSDSGLSTAQTAAVQITKTSTGTPASNWTAALRITCSGTNVNASASNYGIMSYVQNAGTTSYNYGFYAYVSGATTNYSFYGASGAMYNAGNVSFGGTLAVTGALTINTNYGITSGGVITGSALTIATNYGIDSTGKGKFLSGTGSDSNTVYVKDSNNQLKERAIDSLVWSGIYVPIGTVLMFAGSSAPTNYAICNGQALSRTTYATLYALIGTTYGVGDGSTTFNLPDMRESSAVGVGTYAAVTGTTHGAITAHDAFTLGQFKDDQLQGHKHQGYMSDGQNWDDNAGGSGYQYMANGALRDTTVAVTDGTNGDPRTGTVTRGKRLGLNYIIRIS